MIFLVHTHSPSITVNTAKRLHKWHNDGDWFPSVSPPPHPTLLLAHQSCWFFSEGLEFFCCKRSISKHKCPTPPNTSKYNGKLYLCAFQRKKACYIWNIYFTMPNITVNLKLKARNIRDFLNDKPMPK